MNAQEQRLAVLRAAAAIGGKMEEARQIKEDAACDGQPLTE